MIINVDEVIKSAKETSALIDGKYVPARPISFYSIKYRLKATWLVFTGKADALVWHKQ